MRGYRGCLAVVLGLGTTTVAHAAPQLTEFDEPKAGNVYSPACAPYCGTSAFGTNAKGDVVGWYTTKDIVPHAFVRAADGTFTDFEAKGAGLGGGLDQGTVATAINDGGEIAGQYQDANYVFHGFLRTANGHITRFDAPNAGTAAYQGTVPITINNHGTEAGYYYDANSAMHGFVREHGTITSFDPAGSIETWVFYSSINNAGTVVSFYLDANQVRHGYVRDASGGITSFDCPDAGTAAGEGTFGEAINDQGNITGFVITAAGSGEGFVRTPDGTCSNFTAPGGGPAGTVSLSIDQSGAVTGAYYDNNSATHGFVRYPDGKFAEFSAPDAGGGAGQGTIPWSDHGSHGGVSGYYTDSNSINHGFIWTK